MLTPEGVYTIGGMRSSKRSPHKYDAAIWITLRPWNADRQQWWPSRFLYNRQLDDGNDVPTRWAELVRVITDPEERDRFLVSLQTLAVL